MRYKSRISLSERLAQGLKESAANPIWESIERRFGPGASPQQHIAAYRLLGDTGLLPAEAVFFLVALLIEQDADERIWEIQQRDYEPRFSAIKRAHGLDDLEEWPRGEGPLEWEALQRQYEAMTERVLLRCLAAHQQFEMARLRRLDTRRYTEIRERGRMYFFGPLPSDEELGLLKA